MQDRFVKVMLVLIAGLLVFNLFRSQDAQVHLQLPDLVSSAHAQGSTMQTSGTAADNASGAYKVKNLNGFAVESLKDIIALGDGKSFVVSNAKGFMVYQVVQNK